jgi:hypothetical protein
MKKSSGSLTHYRVKLFENPGKKPPQAWTFQARGRPKQKCYSLKVTKKPCYEETVDLRVLNIHNVRDSHGGTADLAKDGVADLVEFVLPE